MIRNAFEVESAPSPASTRDYHHSHSVAIVRHTEGRLDPMDTPQRYCVLEILDSDLSRDFADRLAAAQCKVFLEAGQTGFWAVALPPGTIFPR